jgi:hypothetical protein
MSLNRNAYYTTPAKVKTGNKDVLKNATDKARKKPLVKMKNKNKAK